MRWPGQRPVVASLSKSYGTLSFRFINQKQKQPKLNLAQSSCVSFGKHQIDRSKGERREWWGGVHIVELAVLLICVGLLFVFGDFYLCFSSRFTVKLTAHLLCLLIGAYCFS